MVSASSLLAMMWTSSCRFFGDLRIAGKHGSEATNENGHGTVISSGSSLRPAAAVFCMITSSSHVRAMPCTALADGWSKEGKRARYTIAATPQRLQSTARLYRALEGVRVFAAAQEGGTLGRCWD